VTSWTMHRVISGNSFKHVAVVAGTFGVPGRRKCRIWAQWKQHKTLQRRRSCVWSRSVKT